METGQVTLSHALDAAWAQAAVASEAAPANATAGSQLMAHEGLAERMLAAEAPAAPGEPAATAASTDPHGQTAVVQTFVRAQTPAPDTAPHGADNTLPAATNALSEFALPASQLVPATLVGLQVEVAWTWLVPKPATNALQDTEAAEDAPAPSREDVTDDHDDEPALQDEPEAPEPDAADAVLDAPADDCAPLVRALQAALAAAVQPPALMAAAEQWKRGRCVIVACPRGLDAEGPAWAFVLWPRRAAHASAPSLFGRRVEARLQWSRPGVAPRWCHARMVKEHHPRRGRQLVPLDVPGVPGLALACTVQLGPVVVERRRACEVCVRIDAVRRFWGALGAQWSVHVVVCSLPLATAFPSVSSEELPC